MTDRALWQTHDLTQHLSLLHGAASLATMSVVLFRVGEAENLIWLPAAEGWLTMGLLPLAVLGVATMASAPVHAGRFRWAVLFITSLVSINALFLVGQLTQLDAVTHTDAPVGIRDLTVTLIVALAVGATLLVVMAGSNRVLVAAPAALILLAGLIGGTLGSGLHLLVLNMVASDQAIEPFPGMDWLSLGFMVLLLLALGAAALGIIGGWRQRSGDEPTAGLMRGIRAITSRIRLILGWLVVVVAVAALVFWFGGVRPQDEAIVSPFDYRATGPIVAGVVAFAVLGTIGLAWRYLGAKAEEQADERAALRQWLALVGFGLGLGAIIWLLGGGRVPDVSIFGIVLKFDDLRQIATSVAVLVPTGFILSRLAATVRDRESRRATAILWDVGSFWPRWYHPFAAPYYTALAVPDLQAYVAEQTDGADAVILAAHSQGTVLGMAALLTSDLSDDQRAKVGFLSYGSPIVQLYGRLFPAHFDSTVVERLGELLGDAETTRWVNLWRDTDPIGGAVGLGQVDVQIDPDHQGDGHFRYEDTVDYDLARGIIAGHLG